MLHACQFTLASPPSASTVGQTSSQNNPSTPITPLPLSAFSGADGFYIIMAIAVLVRVIVSPPDKLQK